jgi:hypothetical protein
MSLAVVPDPDEPEVPCDIAAEQSTLGGMLLSAQAATQVAGIVQADDFYRPAHQILYTTITTLREAGAPADPVAVANALKRQGDLARVGGAPYLHTLTQAIPTTANAGYYARIVFDTARQRDLVRIGTRIAQTGYQGGADITDLLEAAGAELRAVPTAPVGTGWPAPTPLDAAAGARPEFPLEALPSWVGRYAAAVSDATQTPVDLAGCLALAALSTAASGRVWADTGQWREPVCVYTVTAMEPGSRKSAVFAAMTGALFQAEERLVEHMKPRIIEARIAKRIAEGRAEELAVKATKGGGDMAVLDATSAAEAAAEMVVPAQPKLIADDITPENLARRLAEQDGRLALLAPEGGFFGTLAGRYSGGIPNLDTFLKAHAGEPIRVDRQGREPDFVDQSALTIGISLQPEALNEVFATPGGRGRGLLARILYSLPADNVGYRTNTSAPVPPEAEHDYTRNLQALLFSLRALPEVVHLTFDPAARTRITEILYDDVEPQLRPEGRFGQIRDWGAKYVGAIVRIAALLHLAEHLTDGWGQPITLATLEAAYTIGEYYASHALAVFGLMGTDDTHAAARRVLAWLQAHGPDRITHRDLFTAVRSKTLAKSTDLEAPLALLADLGWIRPQPAPPRAGRGRPPRPAYLIHPDLVAEARARKEGAAQKSQKPQK